MDAAVATIGGQTITLGLIASFLLDTVGLKSYVPQNKYRKWILRGSLLLTCILLNALSSFVTGVPIGAETLVTSALSLATAVMKFEFSHS